MQEIQEKALSRRRFLQGAAVTAAGVMAAGVAGCTTDEPVATPPEDHTAVGLPAAWDDEADVVVVGFGGAGGITAITAADEGASVIMVEWYPNDTATEVNHAPSARFAGGVMVCAQDAKDGSDALYYLSFGTTPRAICDVWGEGATHNVEYWRGLGADFSDPRWGTSEFTQIKGCHTIGTASITGGGAQMMSVLRKQVFSREDKIKIYWETKGMRLIMNEETKEVCGVVARDASGKDLYLKAKKGTAICTGGFEWDEDYKMNFLRGYPSWFYTNVNNDGSGLRMGQAVGGALWHMNSISARAIPYHPDWKKGCGVSLNLPFFFTNKKGKRWFYERPWPSHNAWLDFVNFDTEEAEYMADPAWIIYDDTSRKPLVSTNTKGFLDSQTYEERQYWYPYEELRDLDNAIAKGWILTGDTPEELAAEILKDPENNGWMDPEVFAETFHRYNEFCVNGEDEDFERDPSGLEALSTPPFYAVKVYPGGPNTQGGLKKDEKGRVLDAFDQPIKRLYCAGENGSYYGFLYPTGGGNICEMTIFGQVIGREMAAETAWE